LKYIFKLSSRALMNGRTPSPGIEPRWLGSRDDVEEIVRNLSAKLIRE